jgi:DNA-binding GntR family transcriptional regulator
MSSLGMSAADSGAGSLSALSPALASNVVDILRQQIISGRIAQGEHLVEAELAQAIGVSRGPVRQALTQLEHEGFVELRRHRGAFARRLTRDDVEELYTLRLAIERLAMERAVLRLGVEHERRMSAILDEMAGVRAGYDPGRVVELDLAFHDVVYDAAEHGRLRRTWNSLRPQVAFFLSVRNDRYRDFVEVGHSEHEQLLDVLRAGDVERVDAAIEKHMSGSYHRLLREAEPGEPLTPRP